MCGIVRKYAYQAGLQDVTPHTLRHSFGKHALDAGVDLVTVATLLGHQRLETTAIYTTPSGRDLEKAVSKLERDQARGDLTTAPHDLRCLVPVGRYTQV